MGKKQRGSAIELDPQWLAALEQRIPREDGRRISYKEIGRRLADAIGQKKAWGKSTVERYISGELVTDSMTRAFCAWLGLLYPVISARHPDELDWLEAGRMLREYNPEEFRRELDELRRMAHLEKSRSERKKRHAG